jgi:hypothetical protein
MTKLAKYLKERKAALAFANSIRAEMGLKPALSLMKGVDHDPNNCPIARTINRGTRKDRGVFVGTDSTKIGARTYEHTADVSTFVRRFDNGKMPDLKL